MTSDVILREDMQSLQFRAADWSSYRQLGGILGTWLQVKTRILGLALVGFWLQLADLQGGVASLFGY